MCVCVGFSYFLPGIGMCGSWVGEGIATKCTLSGYSSPPSTNVYRNFFRLKLFFLFFHIYLLLIFFFFSLVVLAAAKSSVLSLFLFF